MIKRLLALIASLGVLLCCFAGCMTYQNATEGGDSPVDPDPVETPTGTCFTVSLTCNGQPFLPSNVVYAQWYNANTLAYVREAQFGEDGVARTYGLDGDYLVVLSGLDEDYTYNPNESQYLATNNSPDVSVTVYRLSTANKTTANNGSTYLKGIGLPDVGIYRAEFTKAGQEIYYSFKPKTGGEYILESWVAIVNNQIDPVIVQVGPVIGNLIGTAVNGGAEGDYTKNFKYSIEVDESNTVNGGASFVFCIKINSVSNSYPVTVDFKLSRAGDYSYDLTNAYVAEPQEDFENCPIGMTSEKDENGDPTYYKYVHLAVSGAVLDASRVKKHDDGYYYYKADDGYCYLLYVSIGVSISVLDLPFNQFTTTTSLRFNGTDYRFFIEGEGSYYNDGTTVSGSGYWMMVHSGYSQDVLDRLYGKKGYTDYLNYDGRYPCNEELKNFLMDYCISSRVFQDGNGKAEQAGVQSAEDDQWLVGCGYYIWDGD